MNKSIENQIQKLVKDKVIMDEKRIDKKWTKKIDTLRVAFTKDKQQQKRYQFNQDDHQELNEEDHADKQRKELDNNNYDKATSNSKNEISPKPTSKQKMYQLRYITSQAQN